MHKELLGRVDRRVTESGGGLGASDDDRLLMVTFLLHVVRFVVFMIL